MFLAKNNLGKEVSLLYLSRSKANAIKQQAPFYCPSCGQEVILKIGINKVPHFAHKTICTAISKGETDLHIQGKQLLFEWMNNQGAKPKLEVYLPEIQQRPDILVLLKNQLVALEFQCSVISSIEMEKRTISYRKHQIYPYWFAYSKLISKNNAGAIDLTDFLSNFVFIKNNQAFILALQPETKKIISLTNIMPYSKNRAYSDFYYYHLSASFDSLFSPNILSHRIVNSWLSSLEKWLFFQPLAHNARSNKFLQLLYRNYIHPQMLPMEVGVPVPLMVLFKTPPIEWQALIWIRFIYKKPLGYQFSERDVKSYIFQKTIHIIQWRRLLYTAEIDVQMKPVYYYLDFLVQIGILEKERQRYIVKTERDLIEKGHNNRYEMRKQFFRQNMGHIMNSFRLTN